MNRIINKISLVFVLAATLCACQKNPSIKEGVGMLGLKVSVPGHITKAMDEDELRNSATVNIYKSDFSGLVRSYTLGELPSRILLAADNYRVDVAAGEITKENPAQASWDQPSYTGSAEFTINGGEETGVTVKCGVKNIVTQIIFDESIEEHLHNYSLKIGLDLDNPDLFVTYNSLNSENMAYFLSEIEDPSVYWEFDGVRTKTGEKIHKTGRIDSCKEGYMYTLRPSYVVEDGDAKFRLFFFPLIKRIEDLIIFEPMSNCLTKSTKYEIWAGHATVHASVNENDYSDPTTIKFEYSTDGENWTEQDAERESNGKYFAVLKNLTPNTHYTYRLVLAGEVSGDPMEFTTEKAQQPENPSFDVYSNAESSKYKSFYDPNHSLWSKKYWDTGNEGATTVGNPVTTPDTGDKMDGSASVSMASRYIVIQFAAGSISTGEYAGTDGTNGKVNFGRPFTSRPTGIRFWMKYKGGTINRVGDSSAPARSGDPDVASLFVATGTWPKSKYGGTDNCPIQVNTGKKSTWVDYPNAPETIAYACYDLPANQSDGEWHQVTMSLDYFKDKEYPTHIVINCAASKYGDYFTGSDSSKLWLDNIELLYE